MKTLKLSQADRELVKRVEKEKLDRGHLKSKDDFEAVAKKVSRVQS